MRKQFIYILFILITGLQLTSCITTRQTNYLQPAKNFIPAYKDTFNYEEYKLKTDDRLFIQVYSMDDKTNGLFNGTNNSNMQVFSSSVGGSNLDLYTYIIMGDGTIHFPIVGDIKVAGKTVRETKGVIENAIRPILNINSVDVRLVGRTFSIIGAGKSGKYTFPKEKVNIYQALAMAGDLGFYADRSKIRILRETPNGNIIKTFDLRSVDIINSEYYYLEPNDVIFIQPLTQQFFGVSTLWAAISTVITTVSFGVGIYYLFFVPKKV
jgi:polysaccharide export outer membrane protein